MVFKRVGGGDDNTPLVRDFITHYECLSNTSENYTLRNALQEIVQETNSPKVIVGEVQMKIKTIRTRYAAELAEITKCESGAG